MGEMRPLEIGIIHSKELHPDYDGFIVMRTASTEKFEVMSLTNMQDSFCWTNDDCPLEVEIIAIDLNDYLYNYANIKNQIFNRR